MKTNGPKSGEDGWAILLDAQLGCSALSAQAEVDWLSRIALPSKLRQARYDPSIALLEIEIVQDRPFEQGAQLAVPALAALEEAIGAPVSSLSRVIDHPQISLVGSSDATCSLIHLSSHGLLGVMREMELGLRVEMFLPGTSEDSAMRYQCTLDAADQVAGVQVVRRGFGDAVDRLTAELARSAPVTFDEAFSIRIDLHSECGQLGFDLGPETIALLSRFPVEVHFSSQPLSPTQ